MTPQQLRNSILQMAIEGKLTKQRPEDGNAADLLKEIQAEKARLVKDGKIKKEKPLAEITEEEIPFEVPDNWCWCKLGDILTAITDGTHQTPKYQTSGVPFISVKDISSGKLDFSNTKFISGEEQNELKKRCNPQKGDILLSKVGTTGIPVIVDCENEFNIFVSVALLKFNNQFVDEQFLQNLIKSPLVQEQCRDNTRGVGNKNWVIRDIVNTLIILPPLAEQKRIVARLEEILPLGDAYEKAYNELQELNKTFPGKLKNSLLQLAIQGKLVEQHPEEGNAADLLKEIQAEKAKLVKEKKIKKEKTLPKIAEEETPFEIPASWCWCRLGELFTLQAGKNISSSLIFDRGKYLCYGGNGVRGYVDCFNCEGDYPIIGRQGALCGNVNVAKGKFYATEHAVVVYLYAATNYSWAAFFLQALKLNQYATATAQPGLAVNKINEVLIPLPPIAEQKRIVAKLEQLLPLCDALQAE